MRVTSWMVAAALAAVAGGAGGSVARAAPPAAVTPSHWSYEAIEGMAARGLVHGYRDAKFLDGRKMTRFEMASLVKRILDSVMELPVPEGDGAVIAETPGTAASRGTGRDQPPLGKPLAGGSAARRAAFTEADLATVRKLTDEYSVELAVIGADLQEALRRVAALEGRVDEIEKTLRDPKGPLQQVISDVARMDKIRLSGYVQARYESFEHTREADSPGGRQPVTDRFNIRRARLVLAARPTEKVGARLQLDAGGPSGLGFSSVETRDAYIDYYFTGNPATGHTATIGQMKLPFGFEVVESSATREAPERARISRFFFPGERDRGFKIAAPTRSRLFYEVGVYNGIAPGRPGLNTNDNNNDKNITGRVRTTVAKKLDVGASLDLGTTLRTGLATGEAERPGGGASGERPYENKKLVLGADFQWLALDDTTLRGEVMWGKANGTHARGWIAQLIHTLDRKHTLVAKYDWFGADDRVLAPLGGGGTPVGDSVPYDGTLSNLALGVVRRLDTSTRVKLFYELHGIGRKHLANAKGPEGRVPWQGNILRFEVITLF